MKFDYDSTPNGISGGSDATLGQVTLPVAGGHPITYTADVLGGEGSLCPAFVGNPALREMDAAIFTNWFENGDGILLVGAKDQEVKHYQMFRILLTDSGHYMLPTDNDNTQRLLDKQREMWCCFAPRFTRVWLTVFCHEWAGRQELTGVKAITTTTRR